jgi:glutathione S-transferase
MKDRRNRPKLNEKGKPIKIKKGTPLAKSLYPEEARPEIERMLNWFLSRFRPYTQHMFKQILTYIQKKNTRRGAQDFEEVETSTAQAVQGDMDHIYQSLSALDKALADRLFICADFITMMDVILFNELSQLLFMNNLLQKSSTTYQKLSNYVAQPNLDEHEIEVGQIRKFDNVVRWYTESMKFSESIHMSLKKYDLQLRTML